MQARFKCKCKEITREKERDERKGEGNDDDDDEKRSSWIEGIRKLSQRWKDRRPSRHDPCSHRRQSESNFWCWLLAPRETIVHRDRSMQLRTRDNYFPAPNTYLSQTLDLSTYFLSLLRDFIYFGTTSSTSPQPRAARATTRLVSGPRRTLVDQIGGGQQKRSLTGKQRDRCLYKLYFKQKIRDMRIGRIG